MISSLFNILFIKDEIPECYTDSNTISETGCDEIMSVVEFLKEYQMNIMLVLSSICGLLAFFILVTKSLPPRRKLIFVTIEWRISTGEIPAGSPTGWSESAILRHF